TGLGGIILIVAVVVAVQLYAIERARGGRLGAAVLPRARCCALSQTSERNAHLVRVTEESMYLGIKQAVVGHRLSDISHAIQQHVESAGYSVVTEFVGHGIGRQLHEEPQVPNYGKPGQGPRLQVGMVLAIEPMVNVGKAAVKVLDDRWTAVTVDGSLSAHFEHTIAIQPSGPPRILSQL
ncbi:MAG: M24 family metallopeptidase, partial [Planctomycetota bacterium]